jgi:two-component system, NarL family, sensor kinase
MKWCCTYLLIFFSINHINGQIDSRQKDSLLFEMYNGKNDTAKVMAYYAYGDLWFDSNKDTTIFYYIKGKQFAHQKNNYLLEAFSHSYIIVLLNDEGKYKEALDLCIEAKALFEKANAPPKQMAIVHINLGNEWQYLGSFKNAATHYFIGLKLSESVNNIRLQSVCINNLSSLYAEIKDCTNQLVFAKKAREISYKSNDSSRIFSATINLIAALIANKQFAEAYVQLESLKRMALSLNDPEYQLDAAISAAEYYMEIDNKEQAILYFKKVLAQCKEIDNKEYEIAASKHLAQIYYDANNNNLAKVYATQTLQLAIDTKAKNEEALVIELLADIEEKNGNYQSSLLLRKKYEAIVDTLALESSKKEVLKLAAEYETEKKDLQIKNLTQQNDIQVLRGKRKFWVIVALVVAFVGLLLFAFAQFQNFKTKKILLEEQQKNALAMERLRIATDMHDDVGSGLSRIRYISASIQSGTTKIPDGLKKIMELGDDAIQKMSEIIWSLNQSNQNLEELLYYIRGQIGEMVTNANIEFECNLPEMIPVTNFGWNRNRNTYLLVKEAVNNAIKHASAKKIIVLITIQNQLHIEIRDNGKGFDQSVISNQGNGLKNYKKRINDLNGTFELSSEIGMGTTIILDIPLTAI